MTQMELLTKHVMGAPIPKVNVVVVNDQRQKHKDVYHN